MGKSVLRSAQYIKQNKHILQIVLDHDRNEL
jgi:hypothetical protein